MTHPMDDINGITTQRPDQRGLRLPMQAAPIDRTPACAPLSSRAGAEPSIFGINLCDLLPSPAKEICHAVGTGIGTE